MPRTSLAILAVLLASSPAAALVLMHDHDQHSREPFKAGADGAWKQIANILNSPGREYWRDKGSSGFGNDHHEITAACRGDAVNLNQLLRTLAEPPAPFKAEVVLLPGAGVIVDKTGKRLSCDWRARLTYNRSFDLPNRPGHPQGETLSVRLEVFIPDLPVPAPPATVKQVGAWIEDLDNKRFAVREKAERELTRQGRAIRDAVRNALGSKPSLETKCRLERILAQLSQLQVADIQKPRGLAMLSFDMLVERERKLLVSKEPGPRWHASLRLHEAIEFNDELVPLLAAVLDDESFAALKKQTQDAPKDYLMSFKPLLNAKPLAAAARTEHAASYRELRCRLDLFCK